MVWARDYFTPAAAVAATPLVQSHDIIQTRGRKYLTRTHKLLYEFQNYM